MSNFVHLHVHTQYSILDGLSNINKLVAKAKALGMPAIAITDHGNMYGTMSFFNAAKKEGIKPIIGCEAYIAENSRFDKGNVDSERSRGFHCVLLAKNLIGYKNLCKLNSIGFKEGFYYNSRIDKEVLEKYSEGIIVSSACLAGEIPYFIRNNMLERAEEAINWFKRVFKDDFYFELMDHGIPDQKKVNVVLAELSKKHNVKLIATNDVHYIEKEDRTAHDIYICISTASDYDDPKRLRYSGHEYLKTYEEMSMLFPEYPEALANTLEIADKIEEYSIKKDQVILPVFPTEDNMSEMEYLKKLTYNGAEKKFGEITDEIKERLDYELSVIEKMGFPGYFLIVQDFINKTREMGVLVGPGRGSAAGSAVAYSIGITDVDPIKYNLLFERFLNPERISMPDIDVDFDDEGREKVLNYVIEKYGQDHVSQIVTIGSMASKLALKDVARVFKMPIPDADKLTKMIPDRAGSIPEAISMNKDLKEIAEKGPELAQKVIKYAIELEGSIRQTGVHACGVIIGPEDLTNHIPLATAKDSKMMVTQFEGSQVESAGMLKMDFLGLRTLSIIRDAVENIRQTTGIEINIDDLPIDDELTFKLFQNGNTVGIFQFESPGMQKYLKDLQPENIEDLIAMNALYRPGPMDNIPQFINRKIGKEKIEYPHPDLESILKPTYGIMVYQEQIMQTAQICAGFSLGRADVLRRAMGKKKLEEMQAMKAEFIEGAQKNNIAKQKAESIFETMEKFAAYGFNRSHAAAYSIIGYQTGYLKAHYPAQYMASVLTHNLSDLKKITFFIEECQRMGITVLGPSINESNINFTVNKNGDILFGLGGIKGVGSTAVESIITERNANGSFKDIIDFAIRVDSKAMNKKCLESLMMTGAFDIFPGIHRAQFLYKEREDGQLFIDTFLKLINDYKNRLNSPQMSLFGEVQEENLEIQFPECKEFGLLQKLKLEKENIGFYLSGHPLDQYRTTINYFTNCSLSNVRELLDESKAMPNLTFAAMVGDVTKAYDKNGNEYSRFVLEDYDTNISMAIFSEDNIRFGPFIIPGSLIYIKGNVAPRFWKGSNEHVFKFSEIMLLDSVLSKLTKKVILYVETQEITPEYIENLSSYIRQCPGSCALYIEIYDKKHNYVVDTKVSGSGIDPQMFVKLCLEYNLKFKVS
ncbi:MAG: DNA polymerase III subunit alpha [Bacteroidales bacterium]|jgi:DNA polymerase-3 subunit alpha|nr:DNA polymerase III subunit alpha [Bacteroidales bacterium]